eukprot:TRINITY_DN4510_c0_g1_i2.p1 TRINITY_DN4510_c0_g1~~TRINITY_DN4510_c0_g1_i2.p1  ORF type:complete len:499 (+),score=199.38 TRINITY_DN4510_c0_g1_i2:50-1546(+)
MRLLEPSILCLLLLVGLFPPSAFSQGGWSQDEMEIFDLVEELEQRSFYDFMGLSQDASGGEIRKAYRRLSLQLHPDKNPSPDASLQFRLLAGIYEVLKDSGKREIYNRVLVEGLPSWRNPVFYYRRVRKMGLAEGIAYLFLIVSICQYLIHWAAYWERGFTLREVSASISKRKRSKLKDLDEESLLGPKPTMYDTLPFQIGRGLKFVVLNAHYLPGYVAGLYAERRRLQEEEEKILAEEEEALRRREEEKRERKEQKAAKRKRVYREEAPDLVRDIRVKEAEKVFSQPANALQIWSDEDLARLAKLMKKFPGGVSDRWERIAEVMERLPWEVTKMAQKVKGMGYAVPIGSSAQSSLENGKTVSDACLENENYDSEEEEEDSEESEDDTEEEEEEYGVYKLETRDLNQVIEPVKSKTKTKGGKMGEAPKEGDETSLPESENWTQQQQKALESALAALPKGVTERWDRIASKVPGKSKAQCMLRFKTIAEELKKRKEASS